MTHDLLHEPTEGTCVHARAVDQFRRSDDGLPLRCPQAGWCLRQL